MANIVGCLAMSHGPQLMVPPDKWDLLSNRVGEGLPTRPEVEPYLVDEVKWANWRRCHGAIEVLRQKLDELAPDVVIAFGDDQHENILDDNTPPFVIFTGEEAESSTSLRYLNEPISANVATYKVPAELAERLVTDLMEEGFDPAYSRRTRAEIGLGHAFGRPLRFLMPNQRYPVIPVMVNTYYPPAPSAKRCVQFGRAVASVLRRLPDSTRVVLLGSGGLSHTKIDETLDQAFIRAMSANDLEYMAAMPADILVEGTSEIRNWIITAAAADHPATMVEYVPLYRTPTGVGCAMGFTFWDMDA